MVLFPYSDLTQSKSPIAIIFVSAIELVLRPRLARVFGTFFFTKIKGRRYLFNANYPVKWREGLGRTREFHFFTLSNGNAFSPDLCARLNQYKRRNQVGIFTDVLFAVSSDLRTSFANIFRFGNIPKIPAERLQQLKESKSNQIEKDVEALCKELNITIADFVMSDNELDDKGKEKVLKTLARQGLTHVVEPIDMSVIKDLTHFRSFEPSWIPSLLNANMQAELEHKRMEARASKGFNKLFLILGFAFIMVIMVVWFVATSDLSLTLPTF